MQDNSNQINPIKMIQKDLNQNPLVTRPRLISLESCETNLLNCSSSESPGFIKDLNIRNLSRTRSLKITKDLETIDHLTLISHRCVHQHHSIGFIPLAHATSLDQETTSEDELATEMDIEFDRMPFREENYLMSEDASIAYYSKMCRQLNKTSLFNAHRDNAFITEHINDLQLRMRGIRETYMKLNFE